MSPKLLVLYSRDRARPEHPPHLDSLRADLEALGHEVSLVDAEDDAERVSHALVLARPDLVLPALARFGDDAAGVARLASLLELAGVPHVGGDLLCLTTTCDRARLLLTLGDAGVPVPAFAVIHEATAAVALGWPVVVSAGVPDVYASGAGERRAHDDDALAAAIAELVAARGLPLVVERALAGRRLTVVVVAGELLGVVDRVDAAASLAPELRDAVSEHALRACAVLGCRDVAEVDLHLAPDPIVTAVRALPDLGLDQPFRRAAAHSRLGIAGALTRMLESAGTRRPSAPSEPDAAPPTATLVPAATVPAATVPAASLPPPPSAPAGPRGDRPVTPRRRPAGRSRPRVRLATADPIAPPSPRRRPPGGK